MIRKNTDAPANAPMTFGRADEPPPEEFESLESVVEGLGDVTLAKVGDGSGEPDGKVNVVAGVGSEIEEEIGDDDDDDEI